MTRRYCWSEFASVHLKDELVHTPLERDGLRKRAWVLDLGIWRVYWNQAVEQAQYGG